MNFAKLFAVSMIRHSSINAAAIKVTSHIIYLSIYPYALADS